MQRGGAQHLDSLPGLGRARGCQLRNPGVSGGRSAEKGWSRQPFRAGPAVRRDALFCLAVSQGLREQTDSFSGAALCCAPCEVNSRLYISVYVPFCGLVRHARDPLFLADTILTLRRDWRSSEMLFKEKLEGQRQTLIWEASTDTWMLHHQSEATLHGAREEIEKIQTVFLQRKWCGAI